MREGLILGMALALVLGTAPLPVAAQDSPIMRELDRLQEELLRELEARQRWQDQRRGLEREADRREEMRREDLRRDDLRREQAREDERRRQTDEDARRSRNR